MNAYELSDELLRDNTQLTVKAAYMLRQQADRIAELEKLVDIDGTKPYLNEWNKLFKQQQTKPLSEKELYEVFDKCYPNNGNGDVVTLVDFARAIEERHGIK